MRRRGFEVYAETRLWHNSIALWLHRSDADLRHVVQPVQFEVKTQDPNDVRAIEPSLEIDRETAANLMTELWRLGYRPAGEDFRKTDGEVRAMGEHLEDMRRLVFHLGAEPRFGYQPTGDVTTTPPASGSGVQAGGAK